MPEAYEDFRFRVNVETSVKGVKSYSCTVEASGKSMAEVLQQSDALVAQLDMRYPASVPSNAAKES